MKIYESTTARTWLRDDGVVQSDFKEQAVDTLETAQENVAVGKKICGETPRPFLVDMRPLHSMSPEARQFYANNEERHEAAIALLTDSAFSKIMANFFLTINRTRRPTRTFTSEREALAWLRRFL